MTLTAHDAHAAERVILVGCDDAATAPYAAVLRLSAFLPERWPDIARDWLTKNVMFDTQALAMFVEPRFREVFAASGLDQLVSEHYDQCAINVNTVANRSASQGKNAVANLRRIAELRDCRDAIQSLPNMRGQTAVVCGAGPSLDEAHSVLARHRGPIVAVNTSAAALVAHQITPHFVVATESKRLDEWKGGALAGLSRQIPVAIDLLSHPTHPDGIGPALYFSSCDPSMASTAYALGLRPIGYGPSCTTAAVSLCLALGADRVLLVGQDCAFRGDRMYAEGTPYEATRVEMLGDGRASIRKPTKGTSEVDVVCVDGVDGERTWTMPSMLSFVHWFSGQPESVRKRVVNCSRRGVYIQGLEHSLLSDCIQREVQYDVHLIGTWDRWCDARAILDSLCLTLRNVEARTDGELVELYTEQPLLNYWTNPAKLRCKMQQTNGFNPYAYGKAIADAVRQAAVDVREALS